MVYLICIIPEIIISYFIGRYFKTKWNKVVYTICNIIITDILYHCIYYLNALSQRDKNLIVMWSGVTFVLYFFYFIPPGLIGTLLGNIVKGNVFRKKHV
jgi:hypothetical protein